ncbi:MAG: hypothetical protein U0871_08110 [Gemmataceae bacterium]
MRLPLSLAALLALPLPLLAGPLTAGAAKADITPPPGTPMAGYYATRGAEGTHDPLHAKAVVFEQDGTRVALVALDLIATTAGSVAEARGLVEKRTGIPAAHVMISATHSHTGPVLTSGKPRDDAFGGQNELAVNFMKGLPAKIADAVAAADKARVPARVLRAVGREDGLAFNRRFHMIDGTVGWNPGKRNPKTVRPAGPVDPSVPVVLVQTADGKKPIACYVNFSMHLDTVGGLYFSADYPYWLGKCLEAAVGDGLVTVFTMGCSGDVNHLNVNSTMPQKGSVEAARIGTRLAAAVLRAFDHLEPASDGPLRATTAALELPAAPVSPDELPAAREVIAKVVGEVKPVPAFLDQVKAFQVRDVSDRLGRPFPAEVQVISLGDDLAWVGLPGEIFTALGLAVKHGSPFRQTMVASLANGSVGYVPDRPAYPQGNYEVISARVAAGSGEMLVDEAMRQLRGQYKR